MDHIRYMSFMGIASKLVLYYIFHLRESWEQFFIDRKRCLIDIFIFVFQLLIDDPSLYDSSFSGIILLPSQILNGSEIFLTFEILYWKYLYHWMYTSFPDHVVIYVNICYHHIFFIILYKHLHLLFSEILKTCHFHLYCSQFQRDFYPLPQTIISYVYIELLRAFLNVV